MKSKVVYSRIYGVDYKILDYKELIKNLVISNLKTKYSSSFIGFAWSMLNPLMMMLVLYFVFNNVFKSTQEHFALLFINRPDWLAVFCTGNHMAMSSIVGKAILSPRSDTPRDTKS
ncbi:MAG: hypothetical protein FIB07_15100 [Candidatus Methanoperedens sp.]|nr:hypothetical protein [Candidatus Methanoperedens sp.]